MWPSMMLAVRARRYNASAGRLQCAVGFAFTRAASQSAASSQPRLYDLVCIGGGPVGLSLVTALRSSPSTSNLKIALIEGQDIGRSKQWEPDSDTLSNRASSLTPSSISFLEESGAWEHVEQERVQPYNAMHVYDGVNGSRINFDWTMEAQKYNSVARTVATMTENSNLTRGLLRRLEEVEDENLDLISNTRVTSIDNGENESGGLNLSSWPVLSLQPSGDGAAPSTIAARLLVGADGAHSPARTFAGIASNGWDYGRHGVVATLTLSPNSDVFSDKITAFQRFLPGLGGPIAILPLPNNRASLVWSTTPHNASYLKTLSRESLVSMINAAFRLGMADLKYMLTIPPTDTGAHAEELNWRLPHTELPAHAPPTVTEIQAGSVASFPLKFRHAGTYISPRVALVGDAAHTIHPLAGQGLNLGIGDAKALAANITYSVTHGEDIGDILALERYNAERWAANAKVGSVCDMLHKMYSIESGPLAWARGLGLNAIENSPWAKGWLMRQAEG